MKHYNSLKQSRGSFSVKHSFDIIFNKIETVFFTFLCIVFIIASRIESDFTKELSFLIFDLSKPVVQTIAYPFNASINLVVNFQELVNAKKENKKLKEEIEELRSFYIKSLNIHQENKSLRKILNFVTAKSTNFKVVKTFGKSHQIFNQNIFIDAGENRNIKSGSIVTGYKGVIGRVVDVGKDMSRLILLTDAKSHIPVISSKSRARGVLAGNNEEVMELLYLPKNHNIQEGDIIFTSGDGDTLPSGLLVGVVTQVKKDFVGVKMVEDINSSDLATIIEY
jgi:rod shape-determining protein MreC